MHGILAWPQLLLIPQALCHPHTPESDPSLSHLQKEGEESLSFPGDVALGIMSVRWEGGMISPHRQTSRTRMGTMGPYIIRAVGATLGNHL